MLGNTGAQLSGESMVYLGLSAEDDAVLWAIDVSAKAAEFGGGLELGFVELRTLMVATNWEDLKAMGDLAIAGHVSYPVT